ncbi:MAG: YdcF family protein [Cyclobacteriaceae bacterium]
MVSIFVKHKVWKKRLRLAGVIMLVLFSNEFIANELMKAWEIKTKPYADMRQYKLGVVLTGVTIPQLTPNDRIYFQKGADRIVHTVQLYKLGIIERILISGGSGRIVDIQEREADQFKHAMLLMGVPDSVISLENQTRNTHESAVEVKKMLADLGYSSNDCVLITSAFHMRRSLACYRKVGLDLDSFSTDFYAHQGVYYFDAFVIPKLEAFIIWHKLAKEWVGFVAYWISGYV